MSLKNSLVVLTYKIGGSQLTYGKYEYRERTTLGSPLGEDQKFFTSANPSYSECYKRVILSESFVNWAISDEARPRMSDSHKGYTFWRRMSPAERLEWHIAKYVNDMGGSNYSYNILEE